MENEDISIYLDIIKTNIECKNIDDNIDFVQKSIFNKIIEFTCLIYCDKYDENLEFLKYFIKELIKLDEKQKVISCELIFQSITTAFIQLYYNKEETERISELLNKIIEFIPQSKEKIEEIKFSITVAFICELKNKKPYIEILEDLKKINILSDIDYNFLYFINTIIEFSNFDENLYQKNTVDVNSINTELLYEGYEEIYNTLSSIKITSDNQEIILKFLQDLIDKTVIVEYYYIYNNDYSVIYLNYYAIMQALYNLSKNGLKLENLEFSINNTLAYNCINSFNQNYIEYFDAFRTGKNLLNFFKNLKFKSLQIENKDYFKEIYNNIKQLKEKQGDTTYKTFNLKNPEDKKLTNNIFVSLTKIHELICGNSEEYDDKLRTIYNVVQYIQKQETYNKEHLVLILIHRIIENNFISIDKITNFIICSINEFNLSQTMGIIYHTITKCTSNKIIPITLFNFIIEKYRDNKKLIQTISDSLNRFKEKDKRSFYEHFKKIEYIPYKNVKFLKKEILKLKKEKKINKDNISKLKKENTSLKKELERFKVRNEYLKKDIFVLRKRNEYLSQGRTFLIKERQQMLQELMNKNSKQKKNKKCKKNKNIEDINEIKKIKEIKEVGEIREIKEIGEIKEVKEVREIREVKEVREIREVKEVREIQKIKSITLTNSKINEQFVLDTTRKIRGFGEFCDICIRKEGKDLQFNSVKSLNNVYFVDNKENIELIEFNEFVNKEEEINKIKKNNLFIININNHFVALRKIVKNETVYFVVIDSLDNDNKELNDILLNVFLYDTKIIELKSKEKQQDSNIQKGNVSTCAIWSYSNIIALSQYEEDALIQIVDCEDIKELELEKIDQNIEKVKKVEEAKKPEEKKEEQWEIIKKGSFIKKTKKVETLPNQNIFEGSKYIKEEVKAEEIKEEKKEEKIEIKKKEEKTEEKREKKTNKSRNSKIAKKTTKKQTKKQVVKKEEKQDNTDKEYSKILTSLIVKGLEEAKKHIKEQLDKIEDISKKEEFIIKITKDYFERKNFKENKEKIFNDIFNYFVITMLDINEKTDEHLFDTFIRIAKILDKLNFDKCFDKNVTYETIYETYFDFCFNNLENEQDKINLISKILNDTELIEIVQKNIKDQNFFYNYLTNKLKEYNCNYEIEDILSRSNEYKAQDIETIKKTTNFDTKTLIHITKQQEELYSEIKDKGVANNKTQIIEFVKKIENLEELKEFVFNSITFYINKKIIKDKSERFEDNLKFIKEFINLILKNTELLNKSVDKIDFFVECINTVRKTNVQNIFNQNNSFFIDFLKYFIETTIKTNSNDIDNIDYTVRFIAGVLNSENLKKEYSNINEKNELEEFVLKYIKEYFNCYLDIKNPNVYVIEVLYNYFTDIACENFDYKNEELLGFLICYLYEKKVNNINHIIYRLKNDILIKLIEKNIENKEQCIQNFINYTADILYNLNKEELYNFLKVMVNVANINCCDIIIQAIINLYNKTKQKFLKNYNTKNKFDNIIKSCLTEQELQEINIKDSNILYNEYITNLKSYITKLLINIAKENNIFYHDLNEYILKKKSNEIFDGIFDENEINLLKVLIDRNNEIFNNNLNLICNDILETSDCTKLYNYTQKQNYSIDEMILTICNIIHIFQKEQQTQQIMAVVDYIMENSPLFNKFDSKILFDILNGYYSDSEDNNYIFNSIIMSYIKLIILKTKNTKEFFENQKYFVELLNNYENLFSLVSFRIITKLNFNFEKDDYIYFVEHYKNTKKYFLEKRDSLVSDGFCKYFIETLLISAYHNSGDIDLITNVLNGVDDIENEKIIYDSIYNFFIYLYNSKASDDFIELFLLKCFDNKKLFNLAIEDLDNFEKNKINQEEQNIFVLLKQYNENLYKKIYTELNKKKYNKKTIFSNSNLQNFQSAVINMSALPKLQLAKNAFAIEDASNEMESKISQNFLDESEEEIDDLAGELLELQQGRQTTGKITTKKLPKKKKTTKKK